MRGINPLDIESRISLGIAQPLRFPQCRGEVSPCRFHGGEDVVGRAVKYAVNRIDAVRGGAFAQPLHHRNTARNRSLELERRTRTLSRTGQFEPMMCDHRLVGGNEMLALGDRIARKGQRRAVGTADEFDHHIDICPRCHGGHVVFPGEGRQIDAAITRTVPCAHRDHFERAPRPFGEHCTVFLQQPDNPGAYCTETGNRQAQGISHAAPRSPPVCWMPVCPEPAQR